MWDQHASAIKMGVKPTISPNFFPPKKTSSAFFGSVGAVAGNTSLSSPRDRSHDKGKLYRLFKLGLQLSSDENICLP
jgi:hypothetical protein